MSFQGLRNFVTTLFQWDKEWEARVLMFSVVMGFVWALVGAADALLVRIQESAYALFSTLVTPPWDYYAALTLHAERMLFGFAQQIEMGVFVYIVAKVIGGDLKGKRIVWLSLLLINASIFLFEGPVSPKLSFIDSYFSATGWDSLAPLGVPGYSNYVVSPLWWWGWLLLELSTFLWGGWIIYNVVKNGRGKINYVMYFVLATTTLFVMGYVAPFISTNWELLSGYSLLPLNSFYNEFVFWFYGHSVVYMLFLPAVTALYFLVPIMVNRKIYSESMAKWSAVLYLVFSNIVPVHHLYNTLFPFWVNILQEVMTYGVVVPSIMTFFNIWATTKGVKRFKWSVPSAFLALSFGGAIAAGVTGVANATVSFDEVIHNTMWVVGHFHAMIILMIVPGAYALLYTLLPLVTRKAWFSKKLAWLHFWFTLIGGAGISVGFDDLGVVGILRRSMIFPKIPEVVSAELISTVFAVIFGIGQLFFALNTIATIYRPTATLNFAKLGLQEAITLSASTLAPRDFAPPEAPQERVDEKTKRRAELTWSLLGVVLLAITVVSTLPYATVVGGAIQNIPSSYLADPPQVDTVYVTAYQYYWLFKEVGAYNLTTVNFFVVPPSQKLLFNGTVATGNALANIYIPIFNDRVVNEQLYQDYHSLTWLTSPSTPGVYGFMNGEYNGPFYSYMGGEMIVMPQNGVMSKQELSLYLSSVTTDPYTPKVVWANGSVNLVMSGYGMWNDSDPSVTLLAHLGSSVTLNFYVSIEALTEYSNYVFNVTRADTLKAVNEYLFAHDGHLPFNITIERITPEGSVQIVSSINPVVNAQNSVSFAIQPGVYVYGVLKPISYEFDPYGISSVFLGEDSGAITSLWGVILVVS
jgi:terminal oxidase heme-binding subunit I